MKKIYVLLVFLSIHGLQAQVWPASSWANATNLTSAMDVAGVVELSGLHFNPVNNLLYGVQDSGRLRVLQWNTATNTFTQLANKNISGGPEGITQANLNANEFYVIDENTYKIKRFTYTNNFGTVTLLRSWDLLISPSPMTDTGNTGPEGIVFIPDANLAAIGFVNEQTGQPYTSTKGMGGLIFIAHQDGGYVWVFDLNPNTDDDFAYVGKYATNRSESCDLAFDRTTGMLYILHNVSPINRLEVTNLSTSIVGGERKFNITHEYPLTNPGDGNVNIEGFALTPKCPEGGVSSAWLCRDVSSGEDPAILQDVLRWFNPYAADGVCVPLSASEFTTQKISITPNPASREIRIKGIDNATVQIINQLGQLVLQKSNFDTDATIDISALPNGIYIVEANNNGNILRTKWIKN